MLDGFEVTGFGAALVGSLIYSLCCMVIDVAMERTSPAALIALRRQFVAWSAPESALLQLIEQFDLCLHMLAA